MFVIFLNYTIDRKIEETDANNITPADYAVYVRGLPKNATEEQIRKFFSDQYDLKKPAHVYPHYFGCCGSKYEVKKKRSAGNQIAPVSPGMMDEYHGPFPCEMKVPGLPPSTSMAEVGLLHTGRWPNCDSRYEGSWVAEVSCAHPYGASIEYYLHNQKSIEALRVARARVKKFSSGTPLLKKEATGDRPAVAYPPEYLDRKKAKALKKLARIEKKMAKLNEIFAKRSEKVRVQASDVECAYVVFNNEASRQRCLHDYRTCTHSRLFIPCILFQPKKLRFPGSDGKLYPLTIVDAPEPANIIWQNLEVTGVEKFARRCLTNFCTLLLLSVAFGLIYYAQIQKVQASRKIPSAAVCSTEVPAVHFGYYNFSATTIERDMEKEKELCGEKEYYMYYKEARNQGDYKKELRQKGYLSGEYAGRGEALTSPIQTIVDGNGENYVFDEDNAALFKTANITYLEGRQSGGKWTTGETHIGLCSAGCVSSNDDFPCSYLSCTKDVYDKDQANEVCVYDANNNCVSKVPSFEYDGHKCRDQAPKTKNTYARSMIVACYCLEKVQSAIEEMGLVDGGQSFRYTRK